VEVGAITDQWGAISHVTLGSIEPQGTKKNTGLYQFWGRGGFKISEHARLFDS
jgi:hypothetical protein